MTPLDPLRLVISIPSCEAIVEQRLLTGAREQHSAHWRSSVPRVARRSPSSIVPASFAFLSVPFGGFLDIGCLARQSVVRSR
jgi:hypothetical protein